MSDKTADLFSQVGAPSGMRMLCFFFLKMKLSLLRGANQIGGAGSSCDVKPMPGTTTKRETGE